MKARSVTLAQLVSELERWALTTLKKVPASAPIALQITQSIFAVMGDAREIVGKVPAETFRAWTRRDHIAAFIAAVGGRFTEGAGPFPRLIRKGWVNVQMDGTMTAAEDRPVVCPICGKPSAGSPSTNLCGICLLNRR